jgi:murein DD-endopeptidase MepM/ murein hydrolase activator NlpD
MSDMATPLLRPIRVHGVTPSVVVVLLTVASLFLARPAAASGAPVGPVPAGVWPLAPVPEVVRAFDPPDTAYGAGHRGVDLASAVGAIVVSALPGTVTFAGRLAGRGVVVVDHGETRTTYEPVLGSVRVGQPVLAGDRLGQLELSGSHCLPGACLHWGWRRGEVYLDPLLLVGGGPIRLLPLWGPDPAQAAGTLPGASSWRAPTPPYDSIVAQLIAGATRSGAGVRLPVGLPEPVGAHVGVELGGGQGGMPEQLLHGP